MVVDTTEFEQKNFLKFGHNVRRTLVNCTSSRGLKNVTEILRINIDYMKDGYFRNNFERLPDCFSTKW